MANFFYFKLKPKKRGKKTKIFQNRFTVKLFTEKAENPTRIIAGRATFDLPN